MNEVIDFEGLYRAYLDCRRRKRRTANAQRYEMRLLDNLFETLAALQSRGYSPRRSIRFVAVKPKAREIHAADFHDRVVHHWLVPRLESLFEPVFIHDVYSNRVGKGTHKAVDRLQSFMHSVGKSAWFMQLDIANFFNTIDRPILFGLIQQRLRKWVRNGGSLTQTVRAGVCNPCLNVSDRAEIVRNVSSFPRAAWERRACPRRGQFRRAAADLGSHAARGNQGADIREDGTLKGGLKRRRVHRLFIQPGVELCPHPIASGR